MVDNTFETARRIIGPEINLRWLLNSDEDAPDSKVMRSRSKRGLFDFVSSVGKSLFGIATDGDVRKLQRHLKAVAQHQAEQDQGRKRDLEILNSYITKTNERVQNLANMVIKVKQK